MAKGGNNAGVSILEFVGSLLFLWVIWGAWGAWTMGGSSSLGILAAVVFGAGAISAVGLFFMSLASFAWGWNDEMVESTMMSQKWAAISTVAISAGAGAGGTTWLYAAVLGFILAWIGVAMAKMK
ncbi:MAG: hypothetical protein KGH71_03795 [Candidatus Micrarchaeota archaeon]|nr:hypothetical protein [Candidatus Micrarchaeota archaeon]